MKDDRVSGVGLDRPNCCDSIEWAGESCKLLSNCHRMMISSSAIREDFDGTEAVICSRSRNP